MSNASPENKWWPIRQLPAWVITLLIFWILLLAYGMFAGSRISERLNSIIYDNFALVKTCTTNVDDIAIVTIDDHTIQALDRRWPLPRNYHGALIQTLTEYGVKAISYDVLFLEPNIGDGALYQALRSNGNVVLPSLIFPSGLELNIFNDVVKTGHAALEKETDGVVRSLSLYKTYGESHYPHTTVSLLKATDPDNPALEIYLNRIQASRFIDSNTAYYIGSKKNRFQHYSFADVLAGVYEPEEFRDKVVFVGVTATGLGEKFVPFSRWDKSEPEYLTAIDLQAQFYDELRHEKLVFKVTTGFERVINLFALLLILILVRRLKISGVWSSLVAVVFLITLLLFSYLAISLFHMWVPMGDSLVIAFFFLFVYGLMTAHYDVVEANRRLEERVALRTQELEETNKNLAQEIRDRKAIEKTLRDNENGLRLLFDSLQIGILTTDESGCIISNNKTADKLLHRRSMPLLQGAFLQDLIRQDPKTPNYQTFPSLVDIFHELAGKGTLDSIQVEGEIIDARSEGIPISVTFSRLLQGGNRKFVCIVRDIREQRHAEKITQEFVATVSHELRTPITSIKGSLELIDSGIAGQLTPKTRSLLSLALRNSNRLLVLVNDILDIQRIQLGTLEFKLEPLDLVELVGQSVEVNEAYVQAYGAEVIAKLPPYPIYVLGDYDRLVQVMSNLISNAAKFSTGGGTAIIDVSVVVAKRHARVEVTDYGEGIPEAFQKKIFEKFAQADEAQHRSQGTGLGLSITKALVEQMRGTIDFHSKEGDGATFFFYLPILTPSEIKAYREREENNHEK